MRIIDWSSDLCSSDLQVPHARYLTPCDCIVCRSVGSVYRTFGGESHSSDEPPDAVGSIPSSIRLPAVAGSRSRPRARMARSEEHTSELQSLMRISYAVFCLKKKNKQPTHRPPDNTHKCNRHV